MLANAKEEISKNKENGENKDSKIEDKEIKVTSSKKDDVKNQKN